MPETDSEATRTHNSDYWRRAYSAGHADSGRDAPERHDQPDQLDPRDSASGDGDQ